MIPVDKQSNPSESEHAMKMRHVGIMVGKMAEAVEFYTKALDRMSAGPMPLAL